MPYDPKYPYEWNNEPFQEYDDAVWQQLQDEEERRYGISDPEFGRFVPSEIRQPESGLAKPLYHRDEPRSVDVDTGHRSAGPHPYIPARHMKQVQQHYNNGTTPEMPDELRVPYSTWSDSMQVDDLLQRLRDSRARPRMLIWDEDPRLPPCSHSTLGSGSPLMPVSSSYSI